MKKNLTLNQIAGIGYITGEVEGKLAELEIAREIRKKVLITTDEELNAVSMAGKNVEFTDEEIKLIQKTTENLMKQAEKKAVKLKIFEQVLEVKDLLENIEKGDTSSVEK